MDIDPWSVRLSSASKRYQSGLRSRSDTFLGFGDINVDDEIREEFLCPFCSGYFDIVSLCCHIDKEHPMEAKNRVCPVCGLRVGIDMVAHIVLQHGNLLKMQRKRRSQKGGSHSTLALLRRELQEGNLQALFGGSSHLISSPDPLLSSFIVPMTDDFVNGPQHSSETSAAKKSSDGKISKRKMRSPPLSIKDREEKTNRSEFVQGLLFSTILDDVL